eukprot:365387-Chlamydomonas_euryale.AAC.14
MAACTQQQSLGMRNVEPWQVGCSETGMFSQAQTRHRATPCSLVLDATGHKRKLVEFDKEFNPGYQGAYGIIAGETLHPGHEH